MGNQELKEDFEKLDWSVFPFHEAREVVKVFEYGAMKYKSPFSYRCGIECSRLFAALIRHAAAMQYNGYHSKDDESGFLHAAHIAANALMIIAQIDVVEFLQVKEHYEKKL